MTAARPASSTGTAARQEAVGFAEALARAASRALGDAVGGVLLHGSLTLGDYLPGRSDVDLLVVVDDPLTDTQAAALADAAGRERPRPPVRVDLRVVTPAVAAAPTTVPPMEAYITIDHAHEPPVQVAGRHSGERDLVIEFSVCRAHGRSLIGAPPTELIGEIPDARVLDAGDAQLADWQAIGEDPRYAQLTVLTACRLWHFAEERRHCSKDAAADWALRRDPSLTVVREALHQRHSDPTHPIDAAQAHDLLMLVRRRIADARASP